MYLVDPDQLETRAGRFTGLSGQVEDAAAALRDALAETEGCWGSDEIGRNFAARHVGPSAEVVELLDALPGELLDMRDRLQATARDYSSVDEHNAGLVGSNDAGSH
ncbi:WXG100 family type VII secretion target [Actinoalloteichus hymeniacidonis]|uniref:DUF2580 family protein n=1 Tax=Actinoalloteichus hymeniacidonis TaxID=340345 RepID=A0AAC9HV15_9PSEU|nr:hypothetical protein [Actinoalloteichus hymeniacidonis]AOS65496.1 putative DUF2580 family protein [Actinoalloteichus hymeniacidonis]MBB5906417.1 hypothetical protein [Actinoalloteichus hymeniacidonis]